MPTTATQKTILPLIQVREKAQITLPHKIRKVFGIKQGDYLEPKIKKEGILLRPKMLYDKMPTVELSKKGEVLLKESLDDLEKGRFKVFNNMKDLIADLHK